MVQCPKCNSNLSYQVEEEFDSTIRWRFKQSVSIRGVNATHQFRLEYRKDLEPLFAALRHKDDDVRGDAANALGEIGDPRAVEPLASALKDETSHVRQLAAYALGDIGDQKAVEPLTQALRDENEYVQHAAEKALEEIKEKQQKPTT
jgi:HEAT repeat protein